MKHLPHGTTLVVLALAVSAPLLAREEAKVDYPTGYRACFACHTAQKDHDYVFSLWRE